jgi:hypothetical protein
VLHVEALTVDGDRSKPVAKAEEAELAPDQPATLELAVPWGSKAELLSVQLDATLRSMTPDGDAVVQLEAKVTPPGGTPVAASRSVRLGDGGTGLFEVYGEGERRVILTMRGDQVPRAVVRRPAQPGPAVSFGVAVLRVDGERVVLLETNDLHTFVGQSIEYSFRRGQDDALETVRLSLLPVSVTGDVVTIDAEIEGALPGASGSILLSHNERIVASRRSTSTLQATASTPPAGYRFQVTPDF